MKSKEDLIALANLAGLVVNDEELEELTKDVSSILEYVKKLNDIDTSQDTDLEDLPLQYNVFRNDDITRPDNRDCFLNLAPEIDQDCFRVPLTVQHKESDSE